MVRALITETNIIPEINNRINTDQFSLLEWLLKYTNASRSISDC